MNKQKSVALFAITFSLLMAMILQRTSVSAAPSYSPSDYDSKYLLIGITFFSV